MPAVTRELIHPGEHLAAELNELSMSAAQLARNLGVPTNRVTSIVNGQRAITGGTALRLAHFFGTTPEFWLNLQTIYEVRRAQMKAGKSIQQTKAGGANSGMNQTRARARPARMGHHLSSI